MPAMKELSKLFRWCCQCSKKRKSEVFDEEAQMSQNIQGSPDAKKPCKGILKTSSSFDKHSATASHRKSAKFDEINVLQTYHPPDKDYGHMKIQEPKTPYNYTDADSSNLDYFDPEILADKLREVQGRLDDFLSKESDEEEEEETEEQAARRKEFEKRRKAHYNEFEAVKLARKLIEEEDDDDDDDEDNAKADHKSKDGGTSSKTKDEMEVEENQKEDAQNTSPSSDR